MADRPKMRDSVLVKKGGGKKKPRPINPLRDPANHDLVDLLAALKFGRPAADQVWLDAKIAELKGEDTDG